MSDAFAAEVTAQRAGGRADALHNFADRLAGDAEAAGLSVQDYLGKFTRSDDPAIREHGLDLTDRLQRAVEAGWTPPAEDPPLGFLDSLAEASADAWNRTADFVQSHLGLDVESAIETLQQTFFSTGEGSGGGGIADAAVLGAGSGDAEAAAALLARIANGEPPRAGTLRHVLATSALRPAARRHAEATFDGSRVTDRESAIEGMTSLHVLAALNHLARGTAPAFDIGDVPRERIERELAALRDARLATSRAMRSAAAGIAFSFGGGEPPMLPPELGGFGGGPLPPPPDEIVADNLRTARLRQADAVESYASARRRMAAALRESQMPDAAIATLLDSYEEMTSPDFAPAGREQARMQDGPAARPAPLPTFGEAAWREYDAAIRSRVGPDLFADYVAALKDYRAASAGAAAAERRLYAVGGREALEQIDSEVNELIALKGEIADIARQMNPEVDLAAVYRMIEGPEGASPGRFDPLRRVMAVSLDVTRFDPRQEVYRQIWGSLEGMLGDRERALLDRHFAVDPETGKPIPPELRMARAAAAFAAWAAPAGRRKPKSPFAEIFAAPKRFLDRVANAARGRGFLTVEDIYARARAGKIAARAGRTREKGLRLPLPKDNRDAYNRTRAAIGRMTTHQMAHALRDQDQAIYEARKRRQSVLRNLIHRNPAARGLRGIRSYLSTGYADAIQAEDRALKELLRGRAALSAELNLRRTRHANRAAETLGLPPEPTPPAGPLGPGDGPVRDLPGTIAADLEAQLGTRQAAVVEGQHGPYTVRPTKDPLKPGYTVALGREEADIERFGLGRAADAQSAAALIASCDAVAADGRASMEARRIARLANAAGSRDIKTIRESGLLDQRLDKLINDRDVYAFVYPLQTGDLVYQGSDGIWRASGIRDFQTMRRGIDAHARAAAEVISLDTVRRGEPSPGAPAANRNPETAQGARASEVPEPPARRAAAYAAALEPARLHPDASAAEKAAFAKALQEMPAPALQARQEATEQALADLPSRQLAPAREAHERRALIGGRNALNAALRARGAAEKTRTRAAGRQGPER